MKHQFDIEVKVILSEVGQDTTDEVRLAIGGRDTELTHLSTVSSSDVTSAVYAWIPSKEEHDIKKDEGMFYDILELVNEGYDEEDQAVDREDLPGKKWEVKSSVMRHDVKANFNIEYLEVYDHLRDLAIGSITEEELIAKGLDPVKDKHMGVYLVPVSPEDLDKMIGTEDDE